MVSANACKKAQFCNALFITNHQCYVFFSVCVSQIIFYMQFIYKKLRLGLGTESFLVFVISSIPSFLKVSTIFS